MLDFKVEQSEGRKTLTINGDLTIQNATALQGILMSSMEGSDSLVIHLQNVTDIDLSCLQLFCAAYKTAEASDTCISFSGSCPDIFQKAAQETGFVYLPGCGADCEKSCLWAEE